MHAYPLPEPPPLPVGRVAELPAVLPLLVGLGEQVRWLRYRVCGGGVMTGDETRRDGSAWRDEDELPLDELDRALATYSADGQVDDATGGDAGAEEAFGHRPPAETAAQDEDPDPDTEEGRALRPSPEGRTGPV